MEEKTKLSIGGPQFFVLMALVLVVLVCIGLYLKGALTTQSSQPRDYNSSIDLFRQVQVGETADEVVAVLGTPSSKNETDHTWQYDFLTLKNFPRDDSGAIAGFTDGLVTFDASGTVSYTKLETPDDFMSGKGV